MCTYLVLQQKRPPVFSSDDWGSATGGGGRGGSCKMIAGSGRIRFNTNSFPVSEEHDSCPLGNDKFELPDVAQNKTVKNDRQVGSTEYPVGVSMS